MKKMGSLVELSETLKRLGALVNLCANAGAKLRSVRKEGGLIRVIGPFPRSDGVNGNGFSPIIEIGIEMSDDLGGAYVSVRDRESGAQALLLECDPEWTVETVCPESARPWFQDIARFVRGSDADCAGRVIGRVSSPESFVATVILILASNARGERWQPPQVPPPASQEIGIGGRIPQGEHNPLIDGK